MKYYAVTAKCGHVGRGYYIPIDFPVKADSKTEAAKIVRRFPRVKHHHHKDAILNCREVSLDEYNTIRKKNQADAYLLCHSSTDQRLFCDIEDRIIKEPAIESRLSRKDKIGYVLKKYRIAENDYLYQCKYAIY